MKKQIRKHLDLQHVLCDWYHPDVPWCAPVRDKLYDAIRKQADDSVVNEVDAKADISRRTDEIRPIVVAIEEQIKVSIRNAIQSHVQSIKP